MIYSDLITEKNILLGLDTFDSESTLGALADGLVECSPELKGRRDEVFDALREREERGSTGQQGVAIPHVQLSGLSKTAIVIGVNSAGVDLDRKSTRLNSSHVVSSYAVICLKKKKR